MIENLKDAQDMIETGHDINIEREVRYYAVTKMGRFLLSHDWTLERLDRRLWKRKKPKDRK